MLESILQHLAELHHTVFFLGGVLVAGIISGMCSYYKSRSTLKHTIVKLKM